MIEIRNEKGRVAELEPGTKIKIERFCSLFSDNDKFFDDILYSFEAGMTENNIIFFSNGHLVEAENDVYSMPVTCVVSGYPFYAGVLRFSIIDDHYSVLLTVNFGSLAIKANTVRLSDIFTDDAMATRYTAAFMKLTCQNPASYPYAFFPVYNEAWDPQKVSTYLLVNYWDHASQTFLIRGNTFHDRTASSPYFKLKYIVKKVVEYLGFQATGSWIDDPETDKVYIYTRYAPSDPWLFGCTNFLPRRLTISDFFKILKARFKISPTFSVISGQVTFDNGNTLLKSSDIVDLSEYVSSVTEISTPEVAGYTITLKPDEKDDMFLDSVNIDEKNYVATNRLIVGSGEKPIEVDGSTLKSKVYTDYLVPQTKQMLWVSQYAGEDSFPLRFLKFSGMKSVAGGKVFPEALPLELDDSDALWYRFLNDSKKVILKLDIPPSVLSGLDTSKPIGFISKQGNFHTAVVVSIKYDLENSDVELIETEIECRTRFVSFATPVAIEPINPAISEDIASPKFKAFFELNTTGLAKIDLELYYPLGRTTSGPYAPLTSTGSITKSTDSNGGGGGVVYLPVIDYDHASANDVELRIRVGTPKYIVQNGIKRFFTAGSGYWFIKSSTFGNGFKSLDSLPVWIVF